MSWVVGNGEFKLISISGDVNELTMTGGDFATLLYTWMSLHAEDDGSVPADMDELKALVIPRRSEKTADDVERAVGFMMELGLVVRDCRPDRLYMVAVIGY